MGNQCNGQQQYALELAAQMLALKCALDAQLDVTHVAHMSSPCGGLCGANKH